MADPDPEPAATQDCRLDSWKEIAAHLRRDVRTVQRWEKTEGLPVHRLRHTHRGAVHAFSGELDRWWRERSTLNTPPDTASAPFALRNIPRWLAIPAIALAALVAAWWSVLRTTDIASAAIVDGRVVASSAGGRQLWSVEIPLDDGTALVPTGPGRVVAVGDLDLDGRREVVVASSVARDGGRETVDRLQVFDSGGRLRWSRSPDDRFTFASGEYGPPWRARDLTIITSPNGPRIAWTVQHSVWWPAMLLTLDAQGRTAHRFVHPGWLGRIEPTRDGRQLVVAGVNNQHDESVVIALDVSRLDGHLAAPGSRFDCLDCPRGAPVRYLRLPRSEGSRGVPLHALVPSIERTPRGIMMRIDHDEAGGGSESIFEFSDTLELLRASFSDQYWQRHLQLERAGTIDHAASQCPEREGPPVLAHAAGRWTRLQPAAHAASEAGGAGR